MSLKLSNFFGLPWNAEMSREESVIRLHQYVEYHSLLSDPSRGIQEANADTTIVINKALRPIFCNCVKDSEAVISLFFAEMVFHGQFSKYDVDELTFLLYCLNRYNLTHLL